MTSSTQQGLGEVAGTGEPFAWSRFEVHPFIEESSPMPTQFNLITWRQLCFMGLSHAAALLMPVAVRTQAEAAFENVSAQIDAILIPYDGPNVPGVSVMVIKDGNVIYRKSCGMADLEANEPSTAATNFRLASISKQFTAMAILILAERGQLHLDGRLAEFFPRFPAYGRNVTIRHLLNHTSGVPEYANHIPAGSTQQLSDRDVLRILQAQESEHFPPGSKFSYCNSNYVLLGLIVAKVSGMPFEKFLADNIFDPLRMDGTVAYVAGKSSIERRAYGYTLVDGKYQRTDQSLTSATLGDGGVYSSVDDLYLWVQELTTPTLINAQSLRQAMMPGLPGAGEPFGYGFGWFIDRFNGRRRIWHGGGTIGFRNQIICLPDLHFTVIVLMNRSDGHPEAIARQIVKLYLPSIGHSVDAADVDNERDRGP